MLKKISNENDKIMYFDSDDDFYNFCVVPKLEIIEYIDRNGDVAYHTDFNLSNKYYDAIKNGMKFIIKDEDSQIYKHGAVSYRTITKPIENLEEYWEDEY